MKKIVKLNGGLGNQMFQYAFALAISKKFSITPILDLSWFEDVKLHTDVIPRSFDLNVFNIKYDIATIDDLEKICKPESESKWTKSMLKHFPDFFGVNYIREKHTFQFDNNLAKSSKYYFYDGYFQHEKYFKHIQEDIKKAFTLNIPLNEKNELVLKKIKETNSVSLHIRRGDYVQLEHVKQTHGTCTTEYYKSAINLITQKVKSPHFFIFSDDIAWVIENFKIDFPITIVDFNQNESWFDLELMKNCKHNIIANSSFSWWGAWLGEEKNKIIIAPKKWLAAKQKYDIVPKRWIKL